MNKGVWEAARSVRPYLATMMPPSEAAKVDAQLAELLSGPAAVDEQALRAVLEQRDETSAFLEDVLDDPYFRPPQTVAKRDPVKGGGYAEIPGTPGPGPLADKFVCPQDDYVWFRPEVGADEKPCPSHPGPLRRAWTE